MRHSSLSGLPLLLCLSLLYPATASAGGFQSPAVGPSNAGVSTTGPASVFHNPGALGFATEARALFGGSLVIGDIGYRRARLATYQNSDSLDFALPIEQLAIDDDKKGSDESVSSNPVAVAPSIFAQFPIGELPLVAGFGVYVPYAAVVNFPANGPQRWQIIDAFLAAPHITPAIGWRALDWLSVGAGVSYVPAYANLTKVQDFAGLSDLGEGLAMPPINQANDFGPDADPAVRELDTLSRPVAFRSGWANGLNFNVGVTAAPVDDLWVGVSYTHSTPLTFRGKFRLDMDDPFFTQDLASQGLLYRPEVFGRAKLSFTLPYVVRGGVRYGFGRLGDAPRNTVALEGALTGWSVVDSFDMVVRSAALEQPALGLPPRSEFVLQRRWRDTYMGMVRVTHRATDTLEGWVAGGIESAAVPDATIDLASPDGTRMLWNSGVKLGLSSTLDLLLTFDVQGILPRRVVTSDYDLGNGTYRLVLYSFGLYVSATR